MTLFQIIYFLAIALCIPSGLASAAPTCSEIFADKVMPDYVLLNKYYNTFFSAKNDAGISNADTGSLNQAFYIKKNLVTNVFSFSPHHTTPSTFGGLYPQETFSDLVKANIDFVTSTYSERREWDASYRQAIYDDAFKFAHQAHYIMVHRFDGVNQTKLNILGSLKVIKADKDTHLPLEIEHGINLPLNAGRKFEPGNFVVHKNTNPKVYSELMLHFIDFAHQLIRQKGHEPHKMIFFTDADLVSARMYKKLGFKAVPGFEAPIKKGDKNYYLIGASAETVASFQNIFKETKKEWQSSDRSGYYSLAETSKVLPIQSASGTYKRFSSLSGPLEVSISRANKAYSVKSKIEYMSFSFWLGEGENVIHQRYKLPYKDLPLYEGWKSADGLAEYRNGHLIFKKPTGNGIHAIYLQVDTKLSDIQSLNFVSTDRDGNILDQRTSSLQ